MLYGDIMHIQKYVCNSLSTVNRVSSYYEFMEFSERLKQLRKQTKKTQKEIAKEAGISFRSYQDYERGILISPNSFNLEKLSKVFHVSIDYLLGRTNLNSDENLVFLSDGRQDELTDNQKHIIMELIDLFLEENKKV